MKRSKTQLLRSLAAVMLLGAGLASCSQDDFADNRQGEPLPPGEYPLILNAGGLEAIATPAQQSAPTTRGTMEGNWDGLDGQSVAVQVGTKVKKYRIVVNERDSKKATLEPIDKDNTLYWESTAGLTVKAWYPYRKIDDEIDLPTAWNSEKDFEDNDWLGAEKVMNFSDKTSHTLQFNHLLSKITVNLKKSDYLAAYDKNKVTVECALSSNSFTFNGVSKDDNDVVGFVSESATPADVTLMRLATPAEGAFASFQCLANPDMETIDITVTVDGTEYKATELKPQESFKPGHTYTFNITVKAEGLEVSVNDGIAWGEDGAVGSGSVDLDIVLDDDSNREFQLADGDEITVKGNGSKSKGKLTFKIPTGSTAKVNLQEINIQTYRDKYGEIPLQNFIKIEGGGKVIFNLIGINTIELAGAEEPTKDRNPGAICTDGSEIMITGDGRLEITGNGDGGIVSKNGGNITIWETNIYMDYTGCYTSKGACIGSYQWDRCGNIVIYKSDVEIKFISKKGFNNDYLPAIGPAYVGTCGNVTITLKDGQNSKSDFLKKITLTDQNGNSALDDHKVVYAPNINDNQHGTLTWLDSNGCEITD